MLEVSEVDRIFARFAKTKVGDNMYLLDCTLRDGGYYNAWDFSAELIDDYLDAMHSASVDIVELGFRSLNNTGFKGACAYTSDEFLSTLRLPDSLTIGVMVNACELIDDAPLETVLEALFPRMARDSCVDLVRIACHVHEFIHALPAVSWLKKKGYKVGFNLMQVPERSGEEIRTLAKNASGYDIDVLYFADSMGSMDPERVAEIVRLFRYEWQGAMGIHTHDNLGLGLSNTLRAIDEGVTWVDSTVTGMGRGPGNTRTEELVIEIAEERKVTLNMIPLMKLVNRHFKSMQASYGWGTNPYYYLAGKYGIHPSYIQEMLADSRYDEEDVLAVINALRKEGGKNFCLNTLGIARHYYVGEPLGEWSPRDLLEGREVLLLGTGPGVGLHCDAIETYIRKKKPLVMALNTQADISSDLIDIRLACHPVRLLADCETLTELPQPLITPFSMLPEEVKEALRDKMIFDFGMRVQSETFSFEMNHCVTPSSLVMAYAFAVLASGKTRQALLAGFDGYPGEDSRNYEMNRIVKLYAETKGATKLIAVTPTRYDLEKQSIYGLNQ